jgi:hypothetical protein
MNTKQLVGSALTVIGVIIIGLSLALFIVYLHQMISSQNFTSLFFSIIFSMVGIVAGVTLFLIGQLLIQNISLHNNKEWHKKGIE